MRLAAFADLQGNPLAAEAILDALSRIGGVEAYALGNVVGSGPDPAGTVALLRKAGVHLVLGPCERAALGKPPQEPLRAQGDANARLLPRTELGWLRQGGPARRLVLQGTPVLLTSDPDPAPGGARLVLHPGPRPRVEVREGVTLACVGRADDASGEAPYVLHDPETCETLVRHAAWDPDARRARTRHV